MGSLDISDLCVLEIRYTELARNSGLHTLWTVSMIFNIVTDAIDAEIASR